MRSSFLFATVAGSLILASPLLAADRRARTEDGKDVILRDDGTWVFADDPKAADKEKMKDAAPGEGLVKDKKSTVFYKGKRGTFVLNLVPGVWKKSEKPNNPVAEAEFVDSDNDVYAMVISERIAIPLDLLKDAAVQNMRAVDPDATILKEEKRTVNGKPVLSVTMDVKAQGTKFTFYSYYYSGDEGSIQVVTWTGQNLFKEMQPEMEAFLNGFEIVKK